MSNHQPKFVHTPSNGSGQKPVQPTFVHTPWATDPQTSRGIYGVSN